MRNFLFGLFLILGASASLSAQEQFLGIPYEKLQAALATETGDNAERIRRVIAFEDELKSLRARGLRAFMASGVSDSVRAVMDARIEAVNQLEQLGADYRAARLAGDDNGASSIYFEYLKALRTLKMSDQYRSLFDGLAPMGNDLYLLPEEKISEEPAVEEPVVVEVPKEEPKPIETPALDLPKPAYGGADNWNFWLGAAATYSLLMVDDSLNSTFGSSADFSSYSTPSIGYSAQMGFARKIGGAFSLFVEGGVAYNEFSYQLDYLDFSTGDTYNLTQEYNLLSMQAAAGLKIRLRRVDFKLAYVYQEAIESYLYVTEQNNGVRTMDYEEIVLDDEDNFTSVRGAVMFEMALSLTRKGVSHRQGDLQLFVRGLYDLDYLEDISQSFFSDYTLAQAQVGLRFQY